MTHPIKRKPLWIACAAAALISGLNPNGFNVIPVLIDYRNSALTRTLIEWRSPGPWGPPYVFQVLLYSAAAVMLWRRRRVRAADWLLLIAFGAAGMTAFRNTAFVAFFAPIYLATYGWPPLTAKFRALDTVTAPAAAVLAGLLLAWKLSYGGLFQLRVAEWKFPVGAAHFVAEKAPDARIWNTYEYGGYLIWALGPRQKTFIDGRALNESVYRDYREMLRARPKNRHLFDDYGVDLIVTNSFEFVSGVLYPLVTTLATSQESGWELVYQDAQALVFARVSDKNSALIAENRLDKSAVFDHLEAACSTYIAHDASLPRCARTLGLLFAKRGQPEKAVGALRTYRRLWPDPDPPIDAALANLSR